MKVVSVLGSPNPKGSSATIARHFLKTASNSGADVQIYELNKMNFKDCQGCRACKSTADKCILKDDLAQVLDAISEADILVCATPIYVFDVPGQVKSFIDRLYSFLKPDYTINSVPGRLARNKKFVFIQTQGNSDENVHSDIYPKYNVAFKYIGFDESYLIRAHGIALGDNIQDRKDIMKETEELAKRLIN